MTIQGNVGVYVTIAFVLVNMDFGEGATLTEGLKDIPEVKEFYNVYGVYDYVVRVEAETIDQIKDIIITKIRGLNYVKSILTMIVVE